jgi:hypothetical protein
MMIAQVFNQKTKKTIVFYHQSGWLGDAFLFSICDIWHMKNFPANPDEAVQIASTYPAG